MRQPKQRLVSNKDEQNFATLDPEDELKDQWDNDFCSENTSSSFGGPTQVFGHSERAKVPKRLRFRSAITVSGSKYEAKVIDRKDLDEESSSSVIVEDSEDGESLFDLQEKLETHQDSVTAPVERPLDNFVDNQDLLQLSSQIQEQIRKGKAVIEQKSLYNDILKLRVAMQSLLAYANRLPDQHGRLLLKQTDSFGTEEKFAVANESLYKMTTAFLQLQEMLLLNSSFEMNLSGDDHVSDEDDENMIQGLPSYPYKNKEVDKLWKKLEKRNIQLNSFSQKVLDYWDKKVREASGKMYNQTSKFKVINQSILSQIQGVLSNRERLFRRAHTRRDSNRAFLCFSSSEDNRIEPEIYDDGDFYELLLKEVANDMSRNDGSNASLLKRSRQRKQYLDRRESKGRRLKYVVHEKMVGFLTPIPMEQSETRTQLFKSLFGGIKNNN